MLPYRPRPLKCQAEATVNEVKLRQLSLLETSRYQQLPKEVEAEALDLLVHLLIAVIPSIEEGGHDEQDNC